jgi:DNA mismatch repair protein MutS
MSAGVSTTIGSRGTAGAGKGGASASEQLSLSDMGASEIAEILRSTDLNTLSPYEAQSLLFEMKKKL